MKLAAAHGYRIDSSFSVEPFYVSLTFTQKPAPKLRARLYLVK